MLMSHGLALPMGHLGFDFSDDDAVFGGLSLNLNEMAALRDGGSLEDITLTPQCIVESMFKPASVATQV